MKKRWQLLQPDTKAVEKISNSLNRHPITAAILVNRQIASAEKAFSFLNVSLTNIRSPFLIKDMDIAARRIYHAILNQEKILIFGDYDVDGISATSILLEFLRYVGADVSYYIPHRIGEGYSLQIKHIFDYAVPNGINLIITADCGSSSHAAVEAARSTGIDVVITDHHKISANLPEALAVVNPKRADCTAGFDILAGVGVAFYLLIGLRAYLRDMSFWSTRPEPNLKHLCDLVALGTVADIVPLLDENRVFTTTGLSVINSGSRRGIKALIETCGISKNSVDTSDIAFRLAPRLNAAGRMDHAKGAVELLTTKNLETARQLAFGLNNMNMKRQDAEQKILDQALECLTKNPRLLQNRILVLSHPQWHEGVLGIVASKLVERYFRPVVLISTTEGVGKGSGRSIPGIDLYEILCACSRDLVSFGGHSMAAGLKIPVDKIDRFRQEVEHELRKKTTPEDFVPKLLIDYELNIDDISAGLIDELESLEPFGAGNPEPLFMARNVRVASAKIVGEKHRKMLLRQPSSSTGNVFNAIQFNINPNEPIKECWEKVAYRLRWNRWNGKKTAQLLIEET